MLPHIALLLWIKASLEKLMCGALVLYAVRHKENVAAKYGHGTFELIATGNSQPKKLK